MAKPIIGTWWRNSKLLPSGEVLRGCCPASTQWVFVGEESSAPKIYTIASIDFDDLIPSFTSRTASGSDPLYAVDYILAEDVVCAVGDNGRIEISFNKGASWSGFALSGNPDMKDVVGVSGSSTANMVAVGDGRISGRDNVGVWTTRWTGSQLYYSVAYRSGVGWVAVGNAGKATHSATAANGSWLAPYTVDSATIWSIGGNDSFYLAGGSAGYVFRSATGLSGSWTRFQLDTSNDILAIAPVGADNQWAVITLFGEIFWSSDNGAHWTKGPYQLTGGLVLDLDAGPNRGGAVGSNGGIYNSNTIEQIDHVPVAAPTSEPAFVDNDDMAGDAVARLLTQFRS